MKNKIKSLAIIAFAVSATFALTFTSCDNDTTSGGSALNGIWLFGNGTTISINGSTGVFTQIGSGSARFHDAVNKGLIGVGKQCLRNLRKTGDLTWTGQELGIGSDPSTPDVAATVAWFNTTITLSANGQSFYSSAFGNSFTKQ
ncbi:MAG: hypothetical protein LBQ94_03390 [Treponema sp.]|nr:hypothetical protein [Treponema sp.]